MTGARPSPSISDAPMLHCHDCGCDLDINSAVRRDILDGDTYKVIRVGLCQGCDKQRDRDGGLAADLRRPANSRASDPPVVGEPTPATLRCYDCGKPLTAAQAVRRNVKVGEGTVVGGGQAYGTSQYGRVDLCPACNKQRDDGDAFWFQVSMVVGTAAMIIALIWAMCVLGR